MKISRPWITVLSLAFWISSLQPAFGLTPSQAVPTASHVPLPVEVRGLYWTASTASSPKIRERLMTYMSEQDLNAVVIDIQMSNGQTSLKNMDALLEQLRQKNIYRIARIVIMKNTALVIAHPKAALRRADGSLWRDRGGAFWADPSAPEVTDYAIELGREAYAHGFDEIQFDYVRFPSEGSVKSIVYPFYDKQQTKNDTMKKFFTTVASGLHQDNIPVSFDLFGLTFWTESGLGVGQRLSDAFSVADFVSPMVYPSHYASGFGGFSNPANHPYPVVKDSLDKGVTIIHRKMPDAPAETVRTKFRPWLQAFNLGAVYGSQKIAAQIQAARDAGASGWILWNANNVYKYTK